MQIGVEVLVIAPGLPLAAYPGDTLWLLNS